MNFLPKDIIKELIGYSGVETEFKIKVGYVKDIDDYYQSGNNIKYLSPTEAIGDLKFQGKIWGIEQFCVTTYIKYGNVENEKTTIHNVSFNQLKKKEIESLDSIILKVENDDFNFIDFSFSTDVFQINKEHIKYVSNVYHDPDEFIDQPDTFGRSIIKLAYNKELAINILNEIKNVYLFAETLRIYQHPDDIESHNDESETESISESESDSNIDSNDESDNESDDESDDEFDDESNIVPQTITKVTKVKINKANIEDE